MNETKLIYKAVFRRRYKQIQRYATHTASLQQQQLSWLLQRGQHTVFGNEHRLTSDMTIAEFQKAVPLYTYDQQKPYIECMLRGERDILWPGLCRWFAKSSGTTNDKSKYIPVTRDALKQMHYRGATDSMVVYLALNPESRIMSGKGLILGGSFSKETLPLGIQAGDLSATLIQNVTPAVNFIRTPSKEVALMSEWESKLKELTSSTINVNVTNISGVPSWMLGVLKKVLAETGKSNITEVWPNLECFFHGGIAFTPYREQYEKLIPSPNMHYLETYNASEGFFGIQTAWDDHALQLVVDNKIFYEFIPMEDFDKPDRKAIPLCDVELGKNYAMVITTPGLWRYIIGDTVKFTQRNPYKFFITGRTKAFINAFGEELMVSNADEALTMTCKQTNALIAEYTAAPTFVQDIKADVASNHESKTDATQTSEPPKAHHSWIIEFTQQPTDMEQFANLLDQNLQKVNSDYEAKRYKGIFLDRLELTAAPQGTFNKWLSMKKGKLGGQLKIPRLSNSRQYYEELLELIKNN